MKKLTDRLYNNQGGQFLISLLLSGICFLVLYLTHPVHWAIGDDVEIMKIVSGYTTGSPFFCAPFLNAFLGYFFTALYNLTAAVSWYTLFHISLLIISAVAVFRLTFLIFSKKGISIFVPAILCILLFFSAFTHMTLYMLFTSNAIVIGCAAIAFLFIADYNEGKKLRYFEYALSGICMLLSFAIRWQSGKAVACFWGLSLIYIIIKSFIKSGKKAFIKLVKLFIFTVVILAVAFLANKASISIKNKTEEGFSKYNSYRSKFMDYTALSWSTNPEFYEELGWDEDFYYLTKSWFFMDSRFNTDNLIKIYQESQKSNYNLITFKEKIFLGYKFAVQDKAGLAFTTAIAGLSILSITSFLLSKEKRKNVLKLLFAICSLGGFAIMCFYLCMGGRFLLHVYQTVAIPTIITLFIAAAELFPKNFFEKIKNSVVGKKILCIILSVIFITLSGLSVALSVYDAYIIRSENYSSRDKFFTALEEYTFSHPDNIYIHTYDDDFRASVNASESKSNYIRWGGCTMYSGAYYEFLRFNGYNTFYSENLYDKNVYLIVEQSSGVEEKTERILSYLENNFGETEMIEIYKNEYFSVYDITHTQ